MATTKQTCLGMLKALASLSQFIQEREGQAWLMLHPEYLKKRQAFRQATAAKQHD